MKSKSKVRYRTFQLSVVRPRARLGVLLRRRARDMPSLHHAKIRRWHVSLHVLYLVHAWPRVAAAGRRGLRTGRQEFAKLLARLDVVEGVDGLVP